MPAEDTFFLAEHMANERGQAALEIGTGSGYLAKILERNFTLVVATDIDAGTLENHKLQNVVCCDGASALGIKFDLVVCNLPYLPSDDIVDKTVDGGHEGLTVPLQIIESASTHLKNDGKMFLLTSSLANYEKMIEEIEKKGFVVRILAKKKLFFEELLILETRYLP
jgi:release factor glutamine methyltransferase